jgi:hypothetical protein
MKFALAGKGRGQNGPASQVAWANQTDGSISQAIRRLVGLALKEKRP